MGPPGSGKGTQGMRLAQHFGIEHISVGDLLRDEVDSGTELGKHVAATMERGELVPDDVVTEMVTPHVARAAAKGGFILDGYPRTLTQAVSARQEADSLNVEADVVVWLDVSPHTLIKRLAERATEEDRPDDTAETISRRLQVYEEATRPLLDYYQGRGLLVTVGAEDDPEHVHAAVVAAIHGKLGD
ncbi:MAG: adenylate kinase [Pseudonocardiales bacterium]|jgi:adenylate kinase|nr:adenylate kinase [Pseudonocardiales bacterium]